ncbi:MAG TPA: EamA family transporter [Thermoanaerobaculia bacterium]|nr:EamA family transporter [Thermoanaerobaculia bacterium]
MQPPRARDLAAFWLLSILWSGNWLFIKIGLGGLPPFRFAGLRLAIAFVLLTIFLLTRARPAVTPAQARAIALIGFLQIGVSYACVFTAEQWIDSGLTALFFSTFAIWVAVLGHFLLPGEPLTARTAVATLAGVGGVAVIQSPALARIGGLQGGSLALGGLLVLVSAVVSALSAVIIKKRLADVSAIASVWGQSIVGVAVLLGGAAIFERAIPSRWTSPVAFALGYLAVVGTFTFLGSQWLIPRLPVGVVGTFPILNTLLALLWGSLLAGERLTARVFAGGALILLGVGLVTVRPRSASAAQRAREAAS